MISPGLSQQPQQSGGVFDTDADSQNPFINAARFRSGLNFLPDRTFEDIFGEDGRQAGGEFPGTVSSDFIGARQGSFFAATGGGSPAGRFPPQFGGNAGLAGLLQDQFDGSSGISTPGRLIQAQFGGDAGLSVSFAGLGSPNFLNQNQFGAGTGLGNIPVGSPFQVGSDADTDISGIGSAFGSLDQSFAGSSRVEARPDVTLTSTITVDRFVTTTNTAFVGQPRTQTIFSLVTQTGVTTVVSN